jgi:hypothetical protein
MRCTDSGGFQLILSLPYILLAALFLWQPTHPTSYTRTVIHWPRDHRGLPKPCYGQDCLGIFQGGHQFSITHHGEYLPEEVSQAAPVFPKWRWVEGHRCVQGSDHDSQLWPCWHPGGSPLTVGAVLGPRRWLAVSLILPVHHMQHPPSLKTKMSPENAKRPQKCKHQPQLKATGLVKKTFSTT